MTAAWKNKLKEKLKDNRGSGTYSHCFCGNSGRHAGLYGIF